MNRSSALTTFAVLAGIVVLLGGAGVLAPALLVDRHNGDMMHLMDMVLRMADGRCRTWIS